MTKLFSYLNKTLQLLRLFLIQNRKCGKIGDSSLLSRQLVREIGPRCGGTNLSTSVLEGDGPLHKRNPLLKFFSTPEGL